MEKSDKVYRFSSKNQHILVVTWKGRKYKVKFTTPYSGVSRFNTSYESLAQRIRESWQFKSGQIIEDAPVMREPKKAAMPAQKVENEPTKPKVASWMQRSVKSGNKTAPADAEETTAKTEETTVNAEGTTAEAPTEAEGAAAENQGPMEQTMFGIKLEEVETYMDAKQYVRDVLGVDVTRKEEVKEYCEKNNIQFPNYQFD